MPVAAKQADNDQRSTPRQSILSLVGSLVLGAILGALLVFVLRQLPEDSTGQAQVASLQEPSSVDDRMTASSSAPLEEESTAGSELAEVAAGGAETADEAVVAGRLSDESAEVSTGVSADVKGGEASPGGENAGTVPPGSELATETGTDPGPAAVEPAEVAEPEPDPEALEETVHSWAMAWSEQRVDDYLASYSVDFTPPGGASRDEWQEQRRSRILRPSWIRLTLGPITSSEVGEDRMSATFSQAYATETYSDEVLKTLVLEWQEGTWKITEERSG